MTSIRNRLLAWLLSGLALFLVAAGICIYFTVRFVLFSEVEEELQQARKVIYNVFENRSLEPGFFLRGRDSERRLRFRDEARWREFDYEDGRLLYQLRGDSGNVLIRSPSLGERTIESPGELSHPRDEIPFRLDDGTRLLGRIDYANPRKWPGLSGDREDRVENRIEIIVARDITDIRKTLALLGGGIWASGLTVALAAGFLISLALRKGLLPLTRLGEEASRVNIDTLTTRFHDRGIAEELHPICEGLNTLMSRLEKSVERERRFSADLAHELRTPLAEMSAMTETAILFPEKVPEDQLEQILGAARRMQQIVENLLLASRWEQNDSRLEYEPVDLASFAEQCWESFAETAEEKNLTLHLSLENEPPLNTNPELFRHILHNLFSNAVEYCPAGGLVRISGLNGTTRSYSSGLFVSNDVQDFDPSNLDHLFDRFWRRDSSRTGTHHSGLGLSVAKAFAEILSLNLTASLEENRIRFDLGEAQQTTS